MIFVDTSAFLAVLLKADINHRVPWNAGMPCWKKNRLY